MSSVWYTWQTMYQIYQGILQDSKMNALLELEVISEFDYLEVIEDTFHNMQKLIVENLDHYDNWPKKPIRYD